MKNHASTKETIVLPAFFRANIVPLIFNLDSVKITQLNSVPPLANRPIIPAKPIDLTYLYVVVNYKLYSFSYLVVLLN